MLASPSNAATQAKRVALQAKPTWTVCYDISLARGMDHEYEEWQQFIFDCLDGRVPLSPDDAASHGGRPPAASNGVD